MHTWVAVVIFFSNDLSRILNPLQLFPMHILMAKRTIFQFADADGNKFLQKRGLLVRAPPVKGATRPMSKMSSGLKRPICCFLNMLKATTAATKWTKRDENSAHRNTWYQISAARNTQLNSCSVTNPIVWSTAIFNCGCHLLQNSRLLWALLSFMHHCKEVMQLCNSRCAYYCDICCLPNGCNTAP